MRAAPKAKPATIDSGEKPGTRPEGAAVAAVVVVWVSEVGSVVLHWPADGVQATSTVVTTVGAGAVIWVTMIVRLWAASGRITVTLYFAPGRTLKYTSPFESVIPDGFSLGSGGDGVQLNVPFRRIVAFGIGLPH